jgi:hypothetical protein
VVLAGRTGVHARLLLATAIVLTVIFGELPGEGRYVGVLQDSCHAPAFAALALIALTLLQPRRLAYVILVVVGLTVVGAATEIIQGLIGRDREFDDVVSDCVGASGMASLWLYATWRGTNRGARLRRSAAVLVCLALAAYWATPLMRCGLGYWARDARFPVLAEFESTRDLYFVVTDPAPPRLVPVQQQELALRVALDAGRWPGLTLTEPVADWRGWHELLLDLENPGSAPLALRLRISDRTHSGDFADRFNSDVALAPLSRATVRFAVEAIAAAPHGRRMDMTRVAQLMLFRAGAAPGEAVLVHRIWLQ